MHRRGHSTGSMHHRQLSAGTAVELGRAFDSLLSAAPTKGTLPKTNALSAPATRPPCCYWSMLMHQHGNAIMLWPNPIWLSEMRPNTHCCHSKQRSLAVPSTLAALSLVTILQVTLSESPAWCDGHTFVTACPGRYCGECSLGHQGKCHSMQQRVDGCATSASTLAAGEEVQHWIWLLRTFSDRCCVTHLNARLLYMVSLANLSCVGANMHVL